MMHWCQLRDDKKKWKKKQNHTSFAASSALRLYQKINKNKEKNIRPSEDITQLMHEEDHELKSTKTEKKKWNKI